MKWLSDQVVWMQGEERKKKRKKKEEEEEGCLGYKRTKGEKDSKEYHLVKDSDFEKEKLH